jgi:hypothetical protein
MHLRLLARLATCRLMGSTSLQPINRFTAAILPGCGKWASTSCVYGWDPAAKHTGFLNAAYNGGQRPIYVLLNRWVDPSTDWTKTNAVNGLAADWVTLATNVMHHPAVLGYLIGNELN